MSEEMNELFMELLSELMIVLMSEPNEVTNE